MPGTHSALNASPYYSFEDDRSKYLPKKGSFLVGAGGAAPGNASFQCGSQELSLAEAQRAGYELGSVSRESSTLSPGAIQELIGKFLGYSPALLD